MSAYGRKLEMNRLHIVQQTRDYVLFNNDLYFDVRSSALTRTRPESEPEEIRNGAPDGFPYREVIPQLELPVTHRCNLNCTYCSFRGRMKERDDLDMQWDTVDKILPYYRNYLEENRIRYARVDYGVTGEPYLRQSIHQDVTDRIRQTFEGSSVRRVWAGPYISNGTLPSQKGMASSFCDVQDVSCDGPRHVHNSMRRDLNGNGSFDALMAFVDSCEGAPEFGTSAVLTAQNPDFVEILTFLFEKHFPSIYMKPVNTRPSVEYGLNEKNLEIFKTGYTQIVDYLLSLSDEQCLRYLLTINKEDFFLRFFFRIKERSHQIYRCGCGKSGLYIDTDGTLYPCAHFMGLKEFSIGDIHNGVDEAKRQAYCEITVEHREPCRDCWARYLCGGGCLYQSYMANDTIYKPDATKCELIKHLIIEGIRLYMHLAAEMPQVLNALPSPFYMEKTDMYADHEQVYTPRAQLCPADNACETKLTLSRNRKNSLLAYREPLVSFRMRQNILHISIKNLDADADSVRLSLFDIDSQPFVLNDLYNYRNYRGVKEFDISLREQRCYAVLDEKQVRKIPYLNDVRREVSAQIDVRAAEDTLELSIPLADPLGRMPEQLGLNLKLNYADQGSMLLAVYEPFVRLTYFADGCYRLTGGEYLAEDLCSLNECDFLDSLGMMPISRWRTVVPNVC